MEEEIDMVITLDSPLPCAPYQDGPHSGRSHAICGQPATSGIITPSDDHTWELLPVCARHFWAAVSDWQGCAD